MTLQKFIQENREDLNACINSVLYRHDGRGGRGTVPTPAPRHNTKELRQWVLNDESLYLWARQSGVRI